MGNLTDFGAVVRIVEAYLRVMQIERTGRELIGLIGNEHSTTNYNALLDYVAEHFSEISEMTPPQQTYWLAGKIKDQYESLFIVH